MNPLLTIYYKTYFRKHENAKSFVSDMDYVHQQMTGMMKNAAPPRFDYDWKDDQTLIFTYHSKRNLIDFASGSVMTKVMWWRQVSYKEVQQEAEKTDEGAISLSLQSAAEIDVKSRIQSIGELKDSMLLAVYGEKDDLIDPNPTRELDGQWDNVRPIGLSESKHFPMLDETAKFNRLLKDFLDVEDDLSVLELKEEWRRRTR